jgi:amino acid adenylation domain-containing protein
VPGCVHDLIEEHASASPEALAVEARGEQLTYRQLSRLSDGLAVRLQRLGVGPEVLVATCFAPSVDLVIAMVGVVKAGGAFLPLGPDDPAERHRYATGFGCRVLLTHTPLAHVTRPLALPFLILDAERASLAAEGRGRPPYPAQPRNLAYVITTSGSTGEPKGVMIEHLGLPALLHAEHTLLGVGPGSRVLQFSSSTFDAVIWEVFGTLTAGGTIVIEDRAAIAPGAALVDILRRRSVTVATMPPSTLALTEPDDLPSLATIVSAGEPCDVRSVAAWAPGRTFVNVYGATEATVVTTGKHLQPGAAVTVGESIAEDRVSVVDRDLRPLPEGVHGEVCIAGIGVGRGYLSRPGLTAERFVPDPAGGPGARMYRTGDGGRLLADGDLEVAGRLDRQVKVRGFRVELGEIETHLLRCPGIVQAVVVMREDRPGERRLVAYVTRAPGSGTYDIATSARGLLRANLPAYLVPSTIVVLDRLPTTTSGKVDRKALPPPALAPRAGRPPASPTEEAVLAIWQEVLGVEGLPVDEDFWTLGGDSLDAVRVLARIADRLAVRLPADVLFGTTTVADVAARVDRTRAGQPAAQCPAGRPPEAGDQGLPSLGQERLWFMDQVSPRNAAYNTQLAVRLRGALDIDTLRASLAIVVQRHGTLRSRLTTTDGRPVVAVAPRLDVPLAVVEASAATCEAALEEEAGRPFELARGPLVRLLLLRLDATDHVLAVTAHHAVFDGWSSHVLLRELEAGCEALRAGREPDLPPLVDDYAAFAARQRQRLDEPASQAALERCHERLGGAPNHLDLPADRVRPAVQSHRGARCWTLGPVLLRQRLEELSRRHGATPSTALLAVFALLLSRQTGQRDLLIGMPVAGRDELSLEQLIGFFVNTVVVRIDTSGDPSFEELLARGRDAVRAAMADQHLSFERVVDVMRLPRDVSRNPLVQVMFNAYTFEPPGLRLPGLTAEVLPEATSGSLFDLTLYVRNDAGRTRIEVVYATDLFDHDRVEALLRQYVHLLEQVLAAPERRLAGIGSLPAAGRPLPEPARSLEPAIQPGLLAQLQRVVQAEPDRPAVVGDGVLTRKEVWQAAGRLAGLLREEGIGAGEVVAVRAERTPWVVVAMLGILRAGAGFALLDARHPAGWVDGCLAQVRPRAWIDVTSASAVPEAGGLLPSRRIRLPADLSHGPADPPASEVAPSDGPLAYVAFTSGTTGGPRAVSGTAAPLVHFLGWYSAACALGSTDRFALLGGLSHDPVLRDVLTPLWLGAELHVPPAEVHGAPAALVRWLADRRVTVVHLTPSLARLLADAAAASASQPALPELRLVALGGDRLLRHDLAAVARLAPCARIVSFYGATETPQAAAWHPLVTSEPTEAPDPLPIGRGISDVDLLVLDGDRHAGIGELGEVCVRTPYLTAGYLADPVLTGQRYVPNPFRSDPTDLVYRTGDLGRYRADGVVEFVGRADGQLKVHGFRVETAEIEAGLRGHPGVRHAVVVGSRAGGDETVLVAYVVPAAGSLRPGDLRAHLQSRLPAHMVPARYVALDAVPLTPNGKPDRDALPDPQPAEPPDSETPTGPVEQRIAEVWAEVLDRPVGATDNFFDLGGTSLAMARVHSRLERVLSRDLSIVQLFQFPSVRALARSLEDAPPASGLDDAERRGARLRAASGRRHPGRGRSREERGAGRP